jgi:hypothetical protein
LSEKIIERRIYMAFLPLVIRFYFTFQNGKYEGSRVGTVNRKEEKKSGNLIMK